MTVRYDICLNVWYTMVHRIISDYTEITINGFYKISKCKIFAEITIRGFYKISKCKIFAEIRIRGFYKISNVKYLLKFQ